MREISVNNVIYKYKIGKQYVKIRMPNGKSITPNFSEVIGVNWSDIELDQHKKSFSIKPSDIEKYIRDNLK